jgi:hypothetical protein
MLDEVLCPIGAAGMRVTNSPLGEQIPGEVPYVEGGTTLSVMGNGAQVPTAYGGFNVHTMDAHGGWAASAVDLVRFAAAFDDPQSSPLLSATSINAMWGRPAGWNPADVVYYGMGWSVRELGGGAINTWHNGSLPGTWTIMVRRSDGLNWAALFNQRSAGSGAIDGALHRAANAVTSWPAGDLFDQTGAVECYGARCPGSAGEPVLRQGVGRYPRVGGSLDLELTAVPGNAFPLLYLGASATQWGAQPLPFSLAFLGYQGCFVSASWDLPVGLSWPGAIAVTSVPIPNDLAWLGVELFGQAIYLFPLTNPTGFVPSSAVRILVGNP